MAESRGRGWLVWVAVGVVAVLAAGVVAVVVSRGSSASAAVRLVPAHSAGDDPFSASVQVVAVSSFPGNVEAIAATTRKSFGSQDGVLVASGTKPGLYGGSGDVHVCDPTKLVSFLAVNPSKARAWASVLDIPPSHIKSYVAGLTPVVLTQDTVVGNHGYRNGRATYETSVLQAGTAVMVDSSGVPRVKCNCGNPLTPPQVLSPPTHTTGTPWTGYDPTHVTSVSPGAPAPGGLTGIDINTGNPITIPIGTAAANRWVSVDAPSETDTATAEPVMASTDGRTWTPAGTFPAGFEVFALAYGSGRWVALARNVAAMQASDTTTQIYTSTDLTRWTQVGSSPQELTDVRYGGGRWLAVGADLQSTDPSTAIATGYTSTSGTTWTPVDMAWANRSFFITVAYGNGGWLAATQGNEDAPGPVRMFASSDGQHWTARSGSAPAAGFPHLAYGAGRWVLANFLGQQAGGTSYVSTDGSTWGAGSAMGATSSSSEPEGDLITAFNSSDTGFLALGEHYADVQDQQPESLSSSDGQAWTANPLSDDALTTLAYGQVPQATAPGAGTATSSTAACPTPAAVSQASGETATNLTQDSAGQGTLGCNYSMAGNLLSASILFYVPLPATSRSSADTTADWLHATTEGLVANHSGPVQQVHGLGDAAVALTQGSQITLDVLAGNRPLTVEGFSSLTQAEAVARLVVRG